MEKQVEFKSGQETLRGSLFIPQGKGPFPSVIFFHGSGGNGETYFKAAKKFSENGILGFAFNYRGCGVSDGKFADQTVGMGIDDGEAAIEFFLTQKEVDKTRIGFCGGSFGGFIASLFAAKFNSKSLLLIAPAAYSFGIYKTHRDSDKELRKDYQESDSYKDISKFRGNLLVVKCEFEDVLPAEMIGEYLKSARNAKKREELILRGAKHKVSDSPQAQETLINKMEDWFLETL